VIVAACWERSAPRDCSHQPLPFAKTSPEAECARFVIAEARCDLTALAAFRVILVRHCPGRSQPAVRPEFGTGRVPRRFAKLAGSVCYCESHLYGKTQLFRREAPQRTREAEKKGREKATETRERFFARSGRCDRPERAIFNPFCSLAR